MKVIGFGKFNRFYWLILLSALFKILINIFFKIEFQIYIEKENISILTHPLLNDHIFVRFIYYYFGFIVLGFIYLISRRVKEKKNNNNNLKLKEEEENNSHQQSINGRMGSIELIYNDVYEELGHRALRPILLIVIIYIISEMLYFYIDQRNMACVNFWVLQIFFIHFILYRKEKLKLYSHQKLSFVIILLLSFGTYFVSSFFRQCEYRNQEYKVDEDFINIIKIFPPKLRENITKALQESIQKANEKGNRACSNKYNIFLLDDYFVYFIVLAAFGYLIASFLKSYSVIKAKSIINQKFISIDIIIIIMGIFGLVLSIFFYLFQP